MTQRVNAPTTQGEINVGNALRKDSSNVEEKADIDGEEYIHAEEEELDAEESRERQHTLHQTAAVRLEEELFMQRLAQQMRRRGVQTGMTQAVQLQLAAIQPKIIQFSTAHDGKELEDWLYQADILLEQLQISETELEVVRGKLRPYWDRAMDQWVRSVLERSSERRGSGILTWQQLKAAMRKEFAGSGTETAAAFTAAKQLKMQHGETMALYLQRAEQLRRKVPVERIADATMVEFMAYGLDVERFPNTLAKLEVEQTQRRAGGEPAGLGFYEAKALLEDAGRAEPSEIIKARRKVMVEAARSNGVLSSAGKSTPSSSEGQRINALLQSVARGEQGVSEEAVYLAINALAAAQGNVSGLHCYRCKGEGHTSTDCKLPDTRICYGCGQKGHIRSDSKCPGKKGKGKDSDEDSEVEDSTGRRTKNLGAVRLTGLRMRAAAVGMESRMGKGMRLATMAKGTEGARGMVVSGTIQIGGTGRFIKVRALVDCGSEEDLISSDFLRRYKLRPVKGNFGNAMGMFGEERRITERLEDTTVRLHGYDEQHVAVHLLANAWDFSVVSTMGDDYDIILGLPFLEGHEWSTFKAEDGQRIVSLKEMRRSGRGQRVQFGCGKVLSQVGEQQTAVTTAAVTTKEEQKKSISEAEVDCEDDDMICMACEEPDKNCICSALDEESEEEADRNDRRDAEIEVEVRRLQTVQVQQGWAKIVQDARKELTGAKGQAGSAKNPAKAAQRAKVSAKRKSRQFYEPAASG